MLIAVGVIYKKTAHHHEASSQVTPVHQEQKPIVNTVKQKQFTQNTTTKLVLSVPAPYHPVKGVLQQTIYVGTADHPTINGGIINAPGLAVNRDLPEALSQEKKPIDNKVNQSRPLLVSNKVEKIDVDSEPFQDNWATSARVRLLLSEATQEGKLTYVLQKTGEMGLPASLAVVPMVESNYQNSAVSVKGAAGAWQLMPSTAKDYGLNKQDRFQFSIATNAALKLLNDLHQQFGNWELAFAAYNAGSQRVKIALAKNPHAQTIDDLDLPLETKTYVKRIMSLNKTMISMEDNHV